MDYTLWWSEKKFLKSKKVYFQNSDKYSKTSKNLVLGASNLPHFFHNSKITSKRHDSQINLRRDLVLGSKFAELPCSHIGMFDDSTTNSAAVDD